MDYLNNETINATQANNAINNIVGMVSTGEEIDGSVGISIPLPFLKSGRALKVVPFGDSITARGAGATRTATGTYETRMNGYWVHAQNYTTTYFRFLDNKGVSGDTTVNLLSRMNDVLLSGADICLMMVGTNDLSQGRTPTQIEASMNDITTQITAAGIHVVIVPILHRNIADGLNDLIDSTNLLYKQIAMLNDKVTYLDGVSHSFNYIVDKNEHLRVTTDGLHPSAYGAWLVGKEVAKHLSVLFNSYLLYDNVFTNSSMTGTAGVLSTGATGVSPTGYSLYYCNYQVMNDGDGNYLRVTTGLGANKDSLVAINGITVSSGNTYFAEVEITIPSTINISTANSFFRILGADSSQVQTLIYEVVKDTQGDNGISMNKVKLKTPTYNVGVGGNPINIYLRIEGDGVASFSYNVKNFKVVKI